MRPVTVVLFFVPLFACNLVKQRERNEIRHFERTGIQSHTFKGPDGDHFTWYKSTGKPKVMLIHGITGSGLSQWSGNADRLGERYDLIIPDLLGHGHSTKNWCGSSVDAQVAHLFLLLDSLGVTDPVYVVGNSYGGAIAANLAEQHPERVKKLVIYDGPASDYTTAMADSVARSRGAKDIMDLLSPADKEGQRRVFATALHHPPKLPGFALRQYNERYIRPYHDAQTGLLADLLKREAEFATKEYRWPMPVYVLWGANDGLIPLATGQGIHRRNHLAAQHLIVVPECGHIANREKPREFEDILFRILAD